MKLMGQSTVTESERMFERLQKLNRKDSEAKSRLIYFP
jgi:hypothetical protein